MISTGSSDICGSSLGTDGVLSGVFGGETGATIGSVSRAMSGSRVAVTMGSAGLGGSGGFTTFVEGISINSDFIAVVALGLAVIPGAAGVVGMETNCASVGCAGRALTTGSGSFSVITGASAGLSADLKGLTSTTGACDATSA